VKANEMVAACKALAILVARVTRSLILH
jgi:hypothetical protein